MVRPVGDKTWLVSVPLPGSGFGAMFEPPWAKFVPPPKLWLVPRAKFVRPKNPLVCRTTLVMIVFVTMVFVTNKTRLVSIILVIPIFVFPGVKINPGVP